MSSSPPKDTWWGLVEQWIAGTHVMLEIVTLAELVLGLVILVVGFAELPPVDLPGEDPDGLLPVDGVPPPEGATVPPGEAADPSVGWASVKQIRQYARMTVLAAIEVDRL
jgi:hypothetical protein